MVADLWMDVDFDSEINSLSASSVRNIDASLFSRTNVKVSPQNHDKEKHESPSRISTHGTK